MNVSWVQLQQLQEELQPACMHYCCGPWFVHLIPISPPPLSLSHLSSPIPPPSLPFSVVLLSSCMPGGNFNLALRTGREQCLFRCRCAPNRRLLAGQGSRGRGRQADKGPPHQLWERGRGEYSIMCLYFRNCKEK